MNKFEATILFNPDLSNQSLENELNSFKSSIENIKGKIINTENWGLRELSYKISNYKKAFYSYYQIEMSGNEISNIQNNLNQN